MRELVAADSETDGTRSQRTAVAVRGLEVEIGPVAAGSHSDRYRRVERERAEIRGAELGDQAVLVRSSLPNVTHVNGTRIQIGSSPHVEHGVGGTVCTRDRRGSRADAVNGAGEDERGETPRPSGRIGVRRAGRAASAGGDLGHG